LAIGGARGGRNKPAAKAKPDNAKPLNQKENYYLF
jgi:hypothetical protein